MMTAIVGCGDKEQGESTGEISDVAVNELADTVEDSSDLPDWTGKKLDLTMWYGTGSYALNRNNIATNDVVTPEIYRVTGVKFSEDSFDNGGDLFDSKLPKIIATGEWPEVLKGCNINELIEQDMVWELSELIPKYMPHLYKWMQQGDFMKSRREDGKIYQIDIKPAIEYAFPEMSPELLARTEVPTSDTGYVLVRDDILKKIKPEAYTPDELEAIFQKNGKFTEEEILNASFNSKEEFYQFLRDVKALGMKVGNREVYSTYAFAGSDNWDFLTVLAGGLNGWNSFPGGPMNNYFTYYDVETEKIEYMYNAPFFKETLRELTTLIQEDVISSDSLTDSRATYEEKCASGQYAVLYGGTAPDVNTLNSNAEGYKYRKVILNIPYNKEKFIPLENKFSGTYAYAFVKSEVAEEDLPQILRFFDFMLTDVGQKLIQWGPRSAGLFEETENGRRFVNKELEAEAVYGESNDSRIKYGLNAELWPDYPAGPNKWQPIYVYDYVPSLSRLNHFYSTGVYNPIETVQSILPNIYSFPTYLDSAKEVWQARSAFETALTKVMTAQNDDEFESLYKRMVDTSLQIGMTEETLAEINDYWVNNLNKDYMHNVEYYLKEVK